MKDFYYFKSLLATVVVLSVFFSLLTGFVYTTGAEGGLIIFALVIVFLIYFYSGSRDSHKKGKTGGTP